MLQLDSQEQFQFYRSLLLCNLTGILAELRIPLTHLNEYDPDLDILPFNGEKTPVILSKPKTFWQYLFPSLKKLASMSFLTWEFCDGLVSLSA